MAIKCIKFCMECDVVLHTIIHSKFKLLFNPATSHNYYNNHYCYHSEPVFRSKITERLQMTKDSNSH